jgi:PmbA protein
LVESNLLELAGFARGEAARLGAQDIACLATDYSQQLVRFANNSLTLAANTREVYLTVYLGVEGRRIVGSTSNINRTAVRNFLKSLYRSARSAAPQEGYVSLPRGPFEYPRKGEVGGREADEGVLAEAARAAIDGALEFGASRVAGIISHETFSLAISTSGGVEEQDSYSRALLNVRAFADSEASGHGLSCAVKLEDLEADRAGRTAGHYARQALNPQSFEEGEYDLLFSHTVAAHFFEHAITFSSAWYVEAGISFLAEQLERQVAAEAVTIEEGGTVEGGLQQRVFDDEGYPARWKIVVEKGILKTYLHNTTTSKKFQTESTGNAGFITPHPWNIIVNPGDSSWEEMVKEMRRGFIVTNNWYTRFQNYRRGEFSTVPRDAAFYVENGQIKHPVTGLRVSGTIPNLLRGIRLMSRDTKWVKWWEVDTPTKSPAALVSGLRVTKAYG